MSDWIVIAKQGDCLPGTSLELVVEDRIVALYNVEGEFFALDGICPHNGGPLGKGALDGCIVTCPWHGWQFDVKNGQCQLSATIQQPKIKVRTENDDVLIPRDW